jgi:hypothetical protein
MDLETLNGTLWERTSTTPDISLARVYSMVRDPQGCLWAATYDGVARYCASASSSDAAWQPVLLDHSAFNLAFDADGNFITYVTVHRGLPYVLRYDGHEPPVDFRWSGERIAYQDTPPDDCENWFSKDWFHGAFDRSGFDRFQSPRECRELVAWQRRLSMLVLPAGLEALDALSPIAASGRDVWLFALRSRPGADHSEQYVLLRYTYQPSYSGEWLIMPWLYGAPDPRTFMVADKARSGVWIASSGGLFFSDGHSVQRMPLITIDQVPIGPASVKLATDKAGRLWAASDLGLFRFDEESHCWQPTEIVENVHIAPDDQGGLWALSSADGGRVSHFDGERWRHHPVTLDCVPKDFSVSAGERLWVTGSGCYLQGFDGKRWVSFGRGGFDTRDALLAQGLNGELYAARYDRLWVYDGAIWKSLSMPGEPGLSRITAVAIDRHNGVWVGYPAFPYLRYFDGKQWREFEGIVEGAVYTLYVDSQDEQWREFEGIVEGAVHALYVDSQGDLWVGSMEALLHYDGQNWEKIPTGDTVTALAEDRQGRIWASGPGGLYVYDPSKEG